MTKDEALKLALEALEQTLKTLDDENAKPGGAIADTIWHSEHVTLFDYLGSEITAIKEALAQPAQQEPPPWWPAVENILTEYGLQAIDFVADFKAALALAQPEQPAPVQQEPVACKTLCELCVKRGYTFCANAVKTTPIYTTPPQRTWVGLTDEDDIDWEDGGNLKDLVKAIEAKLKEKNT